MFLLLGTVFVASLLGSLHCVGMCGPFAILAGTSSAKGKSKSIVSTIVYSLGRLVTYSIVGCVFGALGLALNKGTSFATWQQTATWVAGALMIAVGVIALARHLGTRINLPHVFMPMQRLLKRGFGYTKSLPPVQRAFAIGALTSLMPCGWLYTFAITAAGTGSPMYGVIVMVVFWAGTVPVLTALMLGFDRIGTSIQRKVPVMMATLVIFLGVFTLAWRAPVTIGAETQVVTGTENLAQQLKNVDQEMLPCCAKRRESER